VSTHTTLDNVIIQCNTTTPDNWLPAVCAASFKRGQLPIMRPWYSQVSTSCQLLIRRAVYTNVSIYGIVLFLLMHNAGTSQYWSAVFCVLPRVVCIKYLFHTLIINWSMKQSVMRDHTRRDADLHCLQRYAVVLTRFCWLSTTNIQTPAKILAVITCWSTLQDVCTITFGLMTHTVTHGWLRGSVVERCRRSLTGELS